MTEIKNYIVGTGELTFDDLLKKTASEYPKPSDLDLPFPSRSSYVPTQSEIFLFVDNFFYFPSCYNLLCP